MVSKDSSSVGIVSSDPARSKQAISEQSISKPALFEPSESGQTISERTWPESRIFTQPVVKPTIKDSFTPPSSFPGRDNLIPLPKDIKGYRLITAKKGDSIYRMASRFYKFEITDEILASIQKINPDISNLDLIEPGQKIYFPDFIDTKKTEKDFHIYGVHVGYFLTLDKAQMCIQQLSQIDSRIYIERESFPDLGEKYAVIIGPFVKITETWDLLELLKRKNLQNSRVVIMN